MTDDLDVSAVAADAALLDALSDGTASDAHDLAGLAALRAALDEDLHDLLAAPALTAAGAAPVLLGLHRPSSRSRRSRQAAALLAGAALALSSTGVAAATYEARPGDAFYGLRTAVAGPRAEDPQLLRERLDAVQERLDDVPPAGAPAPEDAAEELAEVATLLSTLDPSQRGDLAQRLAALTEQLAASATSRPGAAGEGAGSRPVGPPQGVPSSPPAEAPGTRRTQQPRPEATRGPGSPPPSRPSGPPSAEAEPPRASPEPPRATPERGGPRGAEPESGEPAPRRTQSAPPSREPAEDPAEEPAEEPAGDPAEKSVQEPARPADEARGPRAGSALDAVPAPPSR